MFENREDAVTKLKKENPESFKLFNVINHIDLEVELEDELEYLKRSSKVRVSFALSKLFVFSRISQFKEFLIAKNAGEDDKALEIFKKCQKNKDFKYFINEIPIQLVYEVLEEINNKVINNLTFFDFQEFVESEMKKIKKMKKFEGVTNYSSHDYLLTNFKIEVLEAILDFGVEKLNQDKFKEVMLEVTDFYLKVKN